MPERFNPYREFTRIVDPEFVFAAIETLVGVLATLTVACLATENYEALEKIYNFVDGPSDAKLIIGFMYNVLQAATEAGIHPSVTLAALGVPSAGTAIDGAHRIQRNMSPKMSWNQKD